MSGENTDSFYKEVTVSSYGNTTVIESTAHEIWAYSHDPCLEDWKLGDKTEKKNQKEQETPGHPPAGTKVQQNTGFLFNEDYHLPDNYPPEAGSYFGSGPE